MPILRLSRRSATLTALGSAVCDRNLLMADRVSRILGRFAASPRACRRPSASGALLDGDAHSGMGLFEADPEGTRMSTSATDTIEELARPRSTSTASSPTSRPTRSRRAERGRRPRDLARKKNEPEFMLEWRLKAFRHWLTMSDPTGRTCTYPPIDYQDIIYYSAPKPKKQLKSLDEVDPELRETFEKLGISLDEQKRAGRRGGRCGVRQRLGRDDLQGEAGGAGHHLLLVLRGGARASRAGAEVSRLGRAVHRQLLRGAQLAPSSATARSVYIPKGVRCPMELSTYFRINAANTGPVRAHADRRRRRRAT